ncbi:MAG: ABC transporter ATP-binding protein [Candidatus Thermoplasmatota archaeon]
MIIVENLYKRYGKILALNNISCRFDDQQVTAIMGENGAGKSTLLKICANILPFDQGSIYVDSYSIVTDSIKARENLGYLPEIPELYDRITGREFLFYIASLRRLQNAQQIITNLSELIGIADHLDFELGGYSKGMKQKISLITAIMHNPKNLLLDEPVYGLDPSTSKTIEEFIQKRKGTTVIATHSTQLVEQTSDTVYMLMHGRIVLAGTTAKILEQYGSIENAYFACKEEKNVRNNTVINLQQRS